MCVFVYVCVVRVSNLLIVVVYVYVMHTVPFVRSSSSSNKVFYCASLMSHKIRVGLYDCIEPFHIE